MELGKPCTREEDLGSQLSNSEALSVFSDMQSSLKGETNPIDKLTVCVNTIWKAKDNLLKWAEAENAGERNSSSKKSIIYC